MEKKKKKEVRHSQIWELGKARPTSFRLSRSLARSTQTVKLWFFGKLGAVKLMWDKITHTLTNYYTKTVKSIACLNSRRNNLFSLFSIFYYLFLQKRDKFDFLRFKRHKIYFILLKRSQKIEY